VEGSIPDLRGTRGDNVRIGCIFLEDQLEANMPYWNKLIAYAEQNKNISLRLYTVNKDGERTIQKLIN
jgi:hypothetical protein